MCGCSCQPTQHELFNMHGKASWQNNKLHGHGRMRCCMAVIMNARAGIAFKQRLAPPSSPGEGLSAAGSSEPESDAARAALCESFDTAHHNMRKITGEIVGELAPLPLWRAAEDSAFEPEADAEAPRRGPNLAKRHQISVPQRTISASLSMCVSSTLQPT